MQEQLHIYIEGLRAESEINLKNTGIFSLNALQFLAYFNTGCPCTQSSYFLYVLMGFTAICGTEGMKLNFPFSDIFQ
jgi:hypothetical protein